MLTTRWSRDNYFLELAVEQDGKVIARGVELADSDRPTFVMTATAGPADMFSFDVSPVFPSWAELEAWTQEHLSEIPSIIAAVKARRGYV